MRHAIVTVIAVAGAALLAACDRSNDRVVVVA